MARSKSEDKQKEANALINTAKAVTEHIAPFLLLLNNLDRGSIGIGDSPMKYLLKKLESLGVSREEIADVIAKIIVAGIPALELSVKALLLTNLKQMVSCSVDPRIPFKYRKNPKSNDTSNEYGIDIDLEAIDIFDKLSVDPLSKEGYNMYFGNKSVETVYEFARAEDFDAFLWFVMHRGKFPAPKPVNKLKLSESDICDDNHGFGTGWSVSDSDATLYSEFSLVKDAQSYIYASCLPGNTFTYGKITGDDRMPISMCIKDWYDENGKIVQSDIVPVSDDQNSVNWYKSDPSLILRNLMGMDDDNFSSQRKLKSKAICNLKYIDCSSSSDNPHNFANGKFRFSILPKPQYEVRCLKPILFNDKCEYDRNGKYSVYPDNLTRPSAVGGWWKYNGKNLIQFSVLGVANVSTEEEPKKEMFPFYNGLTVYEFNYDYVMGMRLFDAKNIAWTVLEAISNTFVGVNIEWSTKQADLANKVRTIIKSIVETEDDETIEDCFFKFDNTKYDELIRRAQEKRARKEPFGENAHTDQTMNAVNDILKEYDDTATLENRMDVIKRVFSTASATISEGADSQDEDSIKFGFITDVMEQLVFALMKTLLSPKVMMLLMVNKEIMGGFGQNPTYDEILREMRSIIISVAKEIRDMILAELWKLVMSKLQPLIDLMSDLVLKESIREYRELIQQLVQYCSISFGKSGNGNMILDTVDYADIDTPPETPNTTKC